MKKYFLLGSILLAAFTFFSFAKKGFDPLAITGVIAEDTFLDVAEVSNLNWREYMSWNAQQFGKESKEYLASLPDVTVWEGKKFEPVKAHYLTNVAYNDYPVVGISHQQAMDYCSWRADRINEIMGRNKKKTNVTYSCRLPTKAEWEKLVSSEVGFDDIKRRDLNNLQFVNNDGTIKENDITSPVKSFTPTLNVYYNLVGNVAEMVAEKGIAKGASWQHLNTEFSIEKDYKYTGPTKWLGFRCVIELK
jgi:formylglycine-generating enzyme required for sulfatase activity